MMTDELKGIPIFCSHFGNGMADLVPDSTTDEKPTVPGNYPDLRAQS